MKASLRFDHVSYAYDERHLFFVSSNDNSLYCVDLIQKSIALLAVFGRDDGTLGLYRSLNKIDDVLFVLPFNDNKLLKYCSCNKIETCKLSDDRMCKITGGIEKNGYLYLYGNSPHIYKIDTRSCKKTIIDVDNTRESYFWVDSFVINDRVIIPIGDSNCLIAIDAEDNVNSIVLGDREEKWELCSIRLLKNNYNVLYRDSLGLFHSSIFNYSGERICDEKVEFPCMTGDIPFTKAFLCDDRWIVLPYYSNDIVQVGVTGGIAVKCDFDSIERYQFADRLFNSYAEINGIVYAIDQISGDLLSLNLNSKTVQIDSLRYSKKPKHYLSNIIRGNSASIIYEREGFVTLNDYMEYVDDM